MTNEEKRAVGGLKKIEVKEEQFKAQHDELLKAFSECGIDADKCNIYDKKYVEYYSAEDFKDLETNFSKDNFALNIKIKAIDRAIIDILKKDPQTPIEALAKSVNKTVAQTKRALNRLVKEGAIKKSDIKVSKDAEIGENTVPSFEPTDDALDVIENQPAKTIDIELRYSYEKRPGVGGSNVMPTTRDFCRNIISQNKLWTMEEITALSARFGYDVFNHTGGFWNRGGKAVPHCRHQWVQNVVTIES